jgi:hypothetical protein
MGQPVSEDLRNLSLEIIKERRRKADQQKAYRLRKKMKAKDNKKNEVTAPQSVDYNSIVEVILFYFPFFYFFILFYQEINRLKSQRAVDLEEREQVTLLSTVTFFTLILPFIRKYIY